MNYRQTHDAIHSQDLLADDLAEEIRDVLERRKDEWLTTGPDGWILRINGDIVLEALMQGLLELRNGSAAYANYFFQEYMPDDRRSYLGARKGSAV